MKFLTLIVFLFSLFAPTTFACEADIDCGIDDGWTCVNPYHPGDHIDNSRCSYYKPNAPVSQPVLTPAPAVPLQDAICRGGISCSSDSDCGDDGYCAAPWVWGGPIYACFCK